MEFSISSERQKSTCHKLPVWEMTENDQIIRETDLSQGRAHENGGSKVICPRPVKKSMTSGDAHK